MPPLTSDFHGVAGPGFRHNPHLLPEDTQENFLRDVSNTPHGYDEMSVSKRYRSNSKAVGNKRADSTVAGLSTGSRTTAENRATAERAVA